MIHTNTTAGLKLSPKMDGISGARAAIPPMATLATATVTNTAPTCKRRDASASSCPAARRGKSTEPIDATRGLATDVNDAASEYWPSAAVGTVWDRRSWSKLVFTAVGVVDSN